MNIIFIQLAVILLVAFLVSYFIRALKQPIIIGYILAGILLSPFLIKIGTSTEIISSFSQFGVAFLLFIVGLHLNPKVIKEIGVTSVIVGLVQIIFTFAVAFIISWKAFGLDLITSSYIGIAIAFSSTIIVMKLLSDKSQIDSLYGKISVGIFIVQDLVAIAVLMFISSIGKNHEIISIGFKGVLIGIGLIVILFLIGYFVLQRITRFVARSQELLFLFSICWCFLIAAIFGYVGFSIEIGALIAGVILSVSPYATEISSKIKPLRDFFLIIFFIILGLQIQITHIGKIIIVAVVFSLIALLIKPLIIMLFMKVFGYAKRINFLVGVTLGQISEFSVIVLGLGVSLNHVLPEIASIIILTLVITLLFSTYAIMYSDSVYLKLSKFLNFFESKKMKQKKDKEKVQNRYDAILFGYNRIGFSILSSLKKIKKDYLVVDFNPDVIKDLKKFHVPSLYGDVFDLELLEDLPLADLKIAISTIPEVESNKLLLETIRSVNPKAIIGVKPLQ